ncbi:flippase [Serratia marcescens]|uniref:flippase n=1 Tax=Serratia marcescens TaxID=615 RepID=UPI001F150F2E|nr:flippase [Serratia marcescens]MDP8609010.1 flippase [Serratia marcescens]MDP8614111.1 flippase [Serratia marcescens]MDP8644166.1 flippase [Serratia marcescens]MDP8654097.1 flippase [Serratia marcescens]MDP8659061.1 flippase [Serratia marcescens]
MKKNIKNLSYMFFVQMANYVFPLITIPIVARIFGPEKLGLINYIAAIVGYFSLVVSYSFNFTGVRRVTREKNSSNQIFSTIFTSQMLLVSISMAIFAICIFTIGDLKNNIALALITFCSCLSLLFTQTWFLQAYSDFKTIALLSFVSKSASCILIVVLIKSPDDILLYAAILNVITLITAIITFGIIISKYRVKLRFAPIKDCIRYLKEDRHLFLSSVVTNLYTTTGIVLLGAISTKQDVGYYSSAQKLIEVAKSVMIMPVYQIIFPILSEKFGRDKNEGVETVKKIMPIFICMSLMMLIGMITFSKLATLIIFGKAFLPSAPIVVILSFGLFAVFYGIIIGGQVMLNMGLDKVFVKIQIIVSVFSLTANYLILPYGGGLTTATIWTVSEFAISLYQYIVLKRMGIILIDRDTFKLSSLSVALRYLTKRDS